MAYQLPTLTLTLGSTAPEQSILLVAGDDHLQPFVVQQAGTPSPQDLTGWTVTFLVKALAGETDTVAAINAAAQLSAPTAGQCQVSLSAAQTAALAGVYFWVLRGIDASGHHETLGCGPFVVQVT